jgi:hypothetical protein
MLPILIALVFMAHQQYLQFKMEEALEKEHLVSITISLRDFHWYKKDKEIKINDHLFDVKSIKQIKPGMLLVTGLYDYQEQQLQEDLKDWMDMEDEEQQKAFIKWISLLYHESFASNYFTSLNVRFQKHYIANTRFSNCVYLKVQASPPKQLL